MPLDLIVLAAGLGKRMRSELPKVLHPLAGRPLLAHVLDAARTLAPRRIFVVHGHGAERVRAAFPDAGVDWVQTCALPIRSEEHTSELQSQSNLVCRLL